MHAHAGVEGRRVDIRPPARFPGFGIGELIANKNLVYFLAWRDIRSRYKHTVIGFTWAVLQPLLFMLVFTLLLSRVEDIARSAIAYPLFTYAGLALWMMFANGFVQSSLAFVNNRGLVTKVFIPKLVLPLAPVLSALVDFCCAMVLLIPLMIGYGVHLTPLIFISPVFVFFASLSAAAVGLWLSALGTKYRDVHLIVPFIVQLWFIATPIGVPLEVVPPKWQLLWALNPMTGAIEGLRWALFPGHAVEPVLLTISAISSLILAFSGLIYFRMNEKVFPDII